MIRQILPSLLAGAGVTLQVFVITLILSLPLACLLQALQQFSGRALKPLFRGYITLMRGTPLLLQLMFRLLRHAVLSRPDAEPGTVDFYRFHLELYRLFYRDSARRVTSAVDPGQAEAGKMLGFSRRYIYFRIQLPQGRCARRCLRLATKS